MGRKQSRSDEEYRKSRARYLANRTHILARQAARYAATEAEVMTQIRAEMTARKRQLLLLAKSRAAFDARPLTAYRGGRDYVLAYKESHACTDCGGSFNYYAMDFDHVRGEKLGELADIAAKWPLARIITEIDKCDLVCANCHRTRTQQRLIATHRIPA